MIPFLAAIVVKLAYLFSGLTLCLVGKSLLEKGISAHFRGEGEIASRKLRIVTSSPGIIFLIAGLAVLVFGIMHETSVEVDGEGKVRFVQSAPDGKRQIDPTILIDQLRSIHGDAPKDANIRANVYYDAAVRCETFVRDAHCGELLLKAVALDPHLIVNAYDSPLFLDRLNDPVFRSYMVARISIFFQQQVNSKSLSNVAKGILSRLEFVASQWPASKNTTVGIVDLRKEFSTGVVDQKVTQALVSILNSDPNLLYAILTEPAHTWVIENEEIQLALSEALDQINLNLISSSQSAE